MSAEQTPVEFPAVFTMHCPNGPTNACVKHARAIEGLYVRIFGLRVPATEAPDDSQCDNCVNEAKSRPTQGEGND